MPSKPPILVIVGPTASGKTALSIEAAEALGGEIISADSRQVYRSLNIGSAKVTKEEMDGIPHHLLDVADPQSIYTGADYVRDANQAISNILNREKLPIVCGGTFFYIQLLRGVMSAAPVPPNPTLRESLSMLTNEELIATLQKLNPDAATPDRIANPRRLIRAIEIITALGTIPPQEVTDSPYEWHLYGINVPLDVLTERIRSRIITRLDQGLMDEIKRLYDGGLSYERLESFGLEYRYGSHLLQGELSEEEFIDILTQKTRQFAKRQYTWLRREPSITWLPYLVDTEKALLEMREVLNR